MRADRRRLSGLLAPVLALVTGACSGPETASPDAAERAGPSSTPTELRVALFGDLRSSYPGVNRDAYSDDILVNVVEPLVAHRGDLTIAPMAAERYWISEDRTQYTFRLREALRYHNGEEVTARQVKQTWERMLDPKTGFQCLPFYDGRMGARLERIEVLDPDTLRFHLDRPSSVFLEKLAYLQCPVPVLHPDSWNERGEWVRPIATGPFRFASWKKGQYVELERFEQYVPRDEPASGLAGRKEPMVDRVKFMVIGDELSTKAALVSGQVDIAASLAAISSLEIRSNQRVRVLDQQGLARRTLLLQTADPLLSDRRIRRAMAHAIDLETFAEVGSLGLSPANPSTLPTASRNHSPPHGEPYAFDPDRSRELLARAGYGGEEIVIKTTRLEQPFFDTAMIAESMLRRAGFNVRVEVLEFATLLSDYFAGNYQVMAFEYTARLTAFMSYHSMLGDKATMPNRWDDTQANTWLDRAARTPEGAARQSLYDDIHRRMMQQVPVINLYNAPIVDVVGKRVSGYAPWAGAKPRLWNVTVEPVE